jgi:hypothetical protein
LAYRAHGVANLHPADAVLNLPAEQHSHGLRKLAVLESTRGSFDDATAAVTRATGVTLGKRQLQQLVQSAAEDVDGFYATHRQPPPSPETDVLVLSVDGKGIVMRPDALRAPTRKAAACARRKLATRLSGGEKPHRKRMAEVGCVYDTIPVPRTPGEVITTTPGDPQHRARPRPTARGKWLTASVTHDASEVIAAVFAEAHRRDPHHQRQWVALVDGNNHQLGQLTAHARRHQVDLAIVVDFIHVLEYLWAAAWCFFQQGHSAAERWVAQHAHAILAGQASTVAAAIRRKATVTRLPPNERQRADRCADYLLAKRVWLDYPTALAAGWPIATGVIEGACRHLVKDRMDRTGARWGLNGAEAVLRLRAVISNGDFDAYWTYHLTQQQQRIHRTRYQAIPA